MADDGISQGSKRAERIFLAGAPSAVAQVRSSLAEEGFFVISFETTGPGEPWSAALRRAIESSSLVIGMLDPPKNASETFFELGLAEGLGKPIILVVSPDTKLPVDIEGHVVVRPGHDVVGAVTFAVDQWRRRREQHPPAAARQRWPLRTDTPIGALADDLLAAAARIESEPASGMSFEALVRDALAASAEVVVETSFPDRQIDIGVWSDTLGRSVGNPLLVEMKARLPPGSRLRELIANLAEYVRTSSAQSLLLVYGGSPSQAALRELRHAPASIISVPITRLLSGLREHPLSEVVESLQADRQASSG